MSEPGSSLLADISDDAPSGESLEFDPAFAALERACQGKPETQYGETIIAAVPPEWKEARSLAASLLERTRDLRVLALFALAKLNLEGLPAFTEVIAQIRYQIEQRWDSVHPQLDPEDDNDPTMRANALYRLQDPAYVIRVIRGLPLAVTPLTGPVTWRDVAVYEGTLEPDEGQEKPTEAFIRGAFAQTDAQRLQRLRDCIDQAQDDVAAIPTAFDEKASGSGPNLSNLLTLLTDLQRMVRRFAVAPAQGGTEAAPVAADDGSAGAPGPAAADRPPGRAAGADIRSLSSVTNRSDALYLLELATAFFREYEPSSPLPILIDRARRLATMDFMDILRDLAPDGLHQAQTVAGPPPD